MEAGALREARVLVVALAVLAALVPTHAAGQEAAAEPQVTDPEGDAVWYSSEDVATSGASATCGVGGRLTMRGCAQGHDLRRRAVPTVGGTPAPGLLDIVHVRFADDGATLQVEMAVASLSNELVTSGLPADEVFYFTVCWSPPGDEASCTGGVGLGVYRVNGTVQFDPFVQRSDGVCEQTGYCWFYADHTLVPGSPGYIRWTVPREAMPEEPALVEPSAATSYWNMAPADLSPTYSTRLQDARLAGGSYVTGHSLVDVAGPGADVPLLPPRTRWSPDLPWETTTQDAVGDVPAERPDLDATNVTLLETERTLTVATQVIRVDEVPLDHHFMVDLHVTTGASVTAGYSAKGGVRSPFSGVCDGGCAPNPRTPLTKPADVTIEPGEPGWINVTFSRTDLGHPARGDTLGGMYIGLALPTAVVQQDAGDARVQQRSLFHGDFVWEQRPWWFSQGPDPADDDASRAIVLDDPLGDLHPDLDAVAVVSNLDAFDITSLRAEGSAPGEMRIELGIRDLANIAPPTSYQAVFYAAAVSTDQGAFMAGYYADDQKKQFLCAPDTAVLTKPEGDPEKVIWQAIDGLLSIARDRGGQAAGGSSPGSIVLLVPYSCFNVRHEGDLALDALAAATFVLREGVPQRADDIHSDGPVVVQAASVAAPPWYARPFGIDNFWDITGILLAVAVSGAGVLAVRRKRGALKRYLHEIEHALAEHAGNARDRERALHVIQHRLKEDLLRNRITESHFVIVERRLDLHLAKLRVQALADAFGDLPHRLLVMLQETLSDGAMDPEDWRLFKTQLHAEPHLTDASRAAILQRVQAWVREETAREVAA